VWNPGRGGAGRGRPARAQVALVAARTPGTDGRARPDREGHSATKTGSADGSIRTQPAGWAAVDSGGMRSTGANRSWR
jgi:hypothetical protein